MMKEEPNIEIKPYQLSLIYCAKIYSNYFLTGGSWSTQHFLSTHQLPTW